MDQYLLLPAEFQNPPFCASGICRYRERTSVSLAFSKSLPKTIHAHHCWLAPLVAPAKSDALIIVAGQLIPIHKIIYKPKVEDGSLKWKDYPSKELLQGYRFYYAMNLPCCRWWRIMVGQSLEIHYISFFMDRVTDWFWVWDTAASFPGGKWLQSSTARAGYLLRHLIRTLIISSLN